MSDPRVLRWMKAIDDKLTMALTGHGERLDAVEKKVAGHEQVLADHGRLIRWLCKKVEGGRAPK